MVLILLTGLSWNWICSGADPGFGQGEAQIPRLKVADVVEWSCASKACHLQLGSRVRLRAVEAFGFLMLKYMHFPHSRDSFSLIFMLGLNDLRYAK